MLSFCMLVRRVGLFDASTPAVLSPSTCWPSSPPIPPLFESPPRLLCVLCACPPRRVSAVDFVLPCILWTPERGASRSFSSASPPSCRKPGMTPRALSAFRSSSLFCTLLHKGAAHLQSFQRFAHSLQKHRGCHNLFSPFAKPLLETRLRLPFHLDAARHALTAVIKSLRRNFNAA